MKLIKPPNLHQVELLNSVKSRNHINECWLSIYQAICKQSMLLLVSNISTEIRGRTRLVKSSTETSDGYDGVRSREITKIIFSIPENFEDSVLGSHPLPNPFQLFLTKGFPGSRGVLLSSRYHRTLVPVSK